MKFCKHCKIKKDCKYYNDTREFQKCIYEIESDLEAEGLGGEND